MSNGKDDRMVVGPAGGALLFHITPTLALTVGWGAGGAGAQLTDPGDCVCGRHSDFCLNDCRCDYQTETNRNVYMKVL